MRARHEHLHLEQNPRAREAHRRRNLSHGRPSTKGASSSRFIAPGDPAPRFIAPGDASTSSEPSSRPGTGDASSSASHRAAPVPNDDHRRRAHPRTGTESKGPRTHRTCPIVERIAVADRPLHRELFSTKGFHFHFSIEQAIALHFRSILK